MPDHRATGKTIASSPSRNFVAVEHQLAKSLEQPQSRLMQEPKLNHGFDRHAVGVDRAVNQAFGSIDHSLETRPSMNLQPSSYVMTAGNVNMIATQHENCLFSSSLSDLFMQLSSNNALYGHSVDTFASHFEEEPFESLEEIEAHTIGNLLPSDDDLFTGLTDRLDNIEQPSDGNDLEELDFFNSVGGMDLGADGSESQNDSEFPGGLSKSYLGSSNGSIAEHPYDELPSRTLFVRNINSNVEDSELKTLFEEYGDIHTLYTACKHRGFVMVSYYDIRAARNAMKALQSKPLRHRKLDIHYSIPKDNPSEKDINQGTLVVFNLDSSVSNDELHQIFGVYGEIKEIRETPHRSNHKFIQFYDVRAAEHALRELNLSDIAGKRIKLELSHLGGLRMSLLQRIPPELEKDERSSYLQQNSPPLNSTAGISGAVRHGAVISSSMENRTILGIPLSIKPPLLESEIHHGISSSVPNSLPSLLRGELFSNQTGLAEPSHSHGKLKFEFQDAPNFHPHSLPEYHDGLNSSIHYKLPHTMASNVNANLSERIDSRQFRGVGTNGHAIEFNDGFFGSAGNGSCSLPGHQYTWGGSYHPQSPGMIWPNSPSFVNDNSMVHPTTQLHGPPIAPSPTLNPITSINNHHVGSAPTGDTSLWDRRHVYAGESPETSSFFPGSLGSIRISNGSVQSMEFLSHNMFPRVVGNSMDLPIPPKNQGLQAHHPRFAMFPSRSYMFHAINSFDPPNERRSRRNEGNINQADKKQYELDIDHISRGEDNRTTLMIKNIPNKYTSKMLLAAIDEQHKGYYDFIYLPIDFKNKCNVGYAFINMVDPRHIISFYQAFNGKKWEKFNSEKVASLAYARIQGKAALIAHFQNSSLMNEDKRCRPILFNTDGPNAGDQMPFPVGVGVRTRPEKPRSITHEEKQQGNLLNSVNGEDSSSTGVGTLLQVLEKGLIKQS